MIKAPIPHFCEHLEKKRNEELTTLFHSQEMKKRSITRLIRPRPTYSKRGLASLEFCWPLMIVLNKRC